jgi:succinylarginine dihydrolase
MGPSKKDARDRIVTFRLTKAEYEWLKSICEGSASSISDAARASVLASAPTAAASGSVEIKLDKFDNKLDQIIELVRTLKQDSSGL